MSICSKNLFLGLKRIVPREYPQLQQNVKTDSDDDGAGDFVSIGREFLTWLWFKSEQRGGQVSLTKTEEVQLHLLKRVALEAGRGEYAQGVVCSGLHAELTEGKEAIRQGKKVKEAIIELHRDQNQWEFNFKADTFYFQSMKIRTFNCQEMYEDASGRLMERIYLLKRQQNDG